MLKPSTEDIKKAKQRIYLTAIGTIFVIFAPFLTGWDGFLHEYLDVDVDNANTIGNIVLFTGTAIILATVVTDYKKTPREKTSCIALLIIWILVASSLILLSGQ